MKLKRIGFAVAGAIAIACAGCSSHMYYSEAQLYTTAVTEELVRLGLCEDMASCKANGMVLWEAGGWKVGPFQGGEVSLQIYRVADERAADALVKRCRKIHAVHPGIPLSVLIQSNAHIDKLRPGTQVVIRKERIQS